MTCVLVATRPDASSVAAVEARLRVLEGARNPAVGPDTRIPVIDALLRHMGEMDAQGLRRRILGLAEPPEGWTGTWDAAEFGRTFLLRLIRMQLDGDLASSRDPWRLHAVESLVADLETIASPTLSHDEIAGKILAAFNHQQVFGLYFGSLQRLPRSIAVRGVVRRPLKMLSAVFDGLLSRPVLQVHLPSLVYRRLDARSNVESHAWMARFLDERPEIPAVYSGSWYYDPQLETVSPHLAHLARFSVENGAILIGLGTNADAIHDATLKSATRRALYENGRYVPVRYARIWPRKSLVEWYRRAGYQAIP